MHSEQRKRRLVAITLGGVACAIFVSATNDERGSLVHAPGRYAEACDGSGGVAIDATHFLNVNDETQAVCIYRQAAHAGPVQCIDISASVGLWPGDEADLEALERVGDRVYGVSSHSRDHNGVLEPTRFGFFALDLAGSVPDLSMTVAGSSSRLLADLLEASNWRTPNETVIALLASRSRLAAGTQPRLAPKDEGTNIEGLALLPGPDQPERLVIGFRNPRAGAAAT